MVELVPVKSAKIQPIVIVTPNMLGVGVVNEGLKIYASWPKLVVRLQVEPQRAYPLGLEEMGRTVVSIFPDTDFMQQLVQPLSGP